jgi:D-sedoheptulose 7-phosphate isomerase
MESLISSEERMQQIRRNFLEAHQLLADWMGNPASFSNFQKAADLMTSSILAGNKIIACGNGGSMCDAMHFAEELSGRFRQDRKALPAVAVSDPSHLTCVANDYGFDQVFSRYVEALGKPGDVLLAISTSGNSPNVIKAAEAALRGGLFVVALTGNQGGTLGSLASVELRIEWTGYSDRIQELHTLILHSLVQYIETGIGG